LASLTLVTDAGLPFEVGAIGMGYEGFKPINVVENFTLKSNIPREVFRFDMRTPEEIEQASGFTSWDDNMSLADHASGFSIQNKTSGYV
jgi:hypothetical protein